MWVQDMTGGRGWIAIALTIFARAQGGRWAARSCSAASRQSCRASQQPALACRNTFC
jgi:ABC-type uncharacterized transport system permease subunit